MSGLPSWARVGAKACCIKRGAWKNTFFVPEEPARDPSYGEVCIIAETGHVSGAPTIWLAEYNHGFGYDPASFRPLITQQDDIATYFHRLLDVPVNASEDA